MSFNLLLVNTCTVSRYATGGIDAYGHAVKTWGNHLLGQPCRLQATGAREVVIGKEVVLADYRLYLPPVSVTERDRVTIDATEYEILAVRRVQNGAGEHHLECDLRAAR